MTFLFLLSTHLFFYLYFITVLIAFYVLYIYVFMYTEDFLSEINIVYKWPLKIIRTKCLQVHSRV